MLLIAPKNYNWRIGRKKSLFYPLALPIIAAATPKNIEVRIIDENVEELDYGIDCDLVGITAITSTVSRAYKIADNFRNLDKKVIIGGIHVSFMPEEALKHADAILVGEAENIWKNVIKDFQNNDLKQVYKSDTLTDLSKLPTPKIDLLKKKKYMFSNLLETSRGCPNNCEFCSVTVHFGRHFRFKPIKNVIKDIKSTNSKLVVFVDDNIYGSPKRAKDLFKALIPLKIKWLAQACINIGADMEALKLAKESGCLGLFIGFESISEKNLHDCNKRINLSSDFEHSILNIHKHKIFIVGSFIFGFDHDTPQILKNTVEYAIKNKLEYVIFQSLTPLPGTTLFKKMDREGRILDKEWDNYDFKNFVYLHKNMPQREMQLNINKAKKEFYSLRSIVKRIGIPYNEKKLFLLLTNLGRYFSLRWEHHKTLVGWMHNSFSLLVDYRKKTN